MFKNFRRRAEVSAEAGLQIRVDNLIELLEQHPDLRHSVTVAQRQRLHSLLPVLPPKPAITNRFECDLACVLVARMRSQLTERFGLLERRWPNTEPHVLAYRDMVDMLEHYTERNLELADVTDT